MIRKYKVREFLGTVATLTAILGVTAPAKAITFNFVNGDDGNLVITKTDIGSGLTLTLNEPRAFNGSAIQSDGISPIVFEATSTNPSETGLKLSSNEPGVSELPYQFQLSFNQDVKLVSYDVTNSEGNGDDGAFFNLTQGGLASNNNPLSTVQTESFTNTSSVFLAGTPILFVSGDIIDSDSDILGDNSDGTNDEVFFLDNIQVELASSSAAVPFEFSPTLGLLAVGGIWGASRLRKRMTAKEVEDKTGEVSSPA